MDPSCWPARNRHSPDGYVYVVEFSSGAVKVGHTTDPATRANAHRIDAARYGLTITRAWLSRPHADHAGNERALIVEGRRIGTQLATEYFDCSFQALASFAAALPMESAAAPQRAPKPAALRAERKRTEARRMRADGLSFREIADALGISLGAAHGYCRAS